MIPYLVESLVNYKDQTELRLVNVCIVQMTMNQKIIFIKGSLLRYSISLKLFVNLKIIST